MFQRLKQSLQRTRKVFTEKLATIFLGKKMIDADLLEELETLLISADIGLPTTNKIMQLLTAQISRQALKDPQALYSALQKILLDLLTPFEKSLDVDIHLPAHQSHKPFVILLIGVNGAGKTTSIGKLAQKFKLANKKVLLAAGDTFRAAAVEQLQIWGERHQIPVIAQKTGGDSAAVIFDAVSAAKSRNIDILLADTAGRLHTQQNLLEELKKIKRVISRADESAPHEILLALDASIGQNSLLQAKQFHQALGVTGIIMTKLDGTAKGGVIFSITHELGLPIRYIGTGESVDDLDIFKAKEFIQALLG